MQSIENREVTNGRATSKLVHVNWKMITSAIAFAINKCYGLKLDLNASIWSLDTLERLAEQKYYQNLTIVDTPNTDSEKTKTVSEHCKVKAAPVKCTIFDYFDQVEGKAKSLDRNDEKNKTTNKNAHVAITNVGNSTGHHTCKGDINICTKPTGIGMGKRNKKMKHATTNPYASLDDDDEFSITVQQEINDI